MAMLHSNIDQVSDKPHAFAFGFDNSAASHALKHASIKIGLVVFFLAVCLLFIIANGVSSNPAASQISASPNTATPGTSNGQEPVSSAAAGAGSSSSASISSTGRDGTAKPSVKVTINGQDIPVPENGSVQKTITSADGNTSLSVSTTTQGSSENNSVTSTNLNVSTDSTSFGSDFSSNVQDGAPMN